MIFKIFNQYISLRDVVSVDFNGYEFINNDFRHVVKITYVGNNEPIEYIYETENEFNEKEAFKLSFLKAWEDAKIKNPITICEIK